MVLNLVKIRKVYTGETSSYRLKFNCPACEVEHEINQTWEFNNDFISPAISPSIKVSGYTFDKNGEPKKIFCHSEIASGKIKFCDDCEHDFKGQTLELIPYPHTNNIL